MDKYHIAKSADGAWVGFRNGELVFSTFNPGLVERWLDEVLGPKCPLGQRDLENAARGLAIPVVESPAYEEAERKVGAALQALRALGSSREEIGANFEQSQSDRVIGPLQHKDRMERLEMLHRELGAIRHAISSRASGPASGVPAGA